MLSRYGVFQFERRAGSEVRLAGNFNDWDPAARRLTRKNTTGAYATTILLPPWAP